MKNAQFIKRSDLEEEITQWEEDRLEQIVKPIAEHAMLDSFAKPETARAVSGCILSISTFDSEKTTEAILENEFQAVSNSARTDTTSESEPSADEPKRVEKNGKRKKSKSSRRHPTDKDLRSRASSESLDGMTDADDPDPNDSSSLSSSSSSSDSSAQRRSMQTRSKKKRAKC